MISGAIFDLDGTLVQTEVLKAESYAKAAVELTPDGLTEAQVIERFKDVVGMPRDQLAAILVERFHLERHAQERMAELGASTPAEAFGRLRLRYYDMMLDDHDLIASQEIPHNIALLHSMREEGYKIGLATMSYRSQVDRILAVIDCHTQFDCIATVEDVRHGKPDPEIYLLVARELEVPPESCLVIEDSPIGVEAGVAAGMRVVAVSTDLTREGLHELRLLDARWIVDDPTRLTEVVKERMAQ